jgi:hydroxymethylglutaryl-CoA reductase
MPGQPTQQSFIGEIVVAKTNFQYEKRQKELEKKRKKEEKLKRKQERSSEGGEDGDTQASGTETLPEPVEHDSQTETP